MNYGHWKTLKEVDIKDYIGFVYVVEFSNGTRYIGAKKIWKTIKLPPSTFKKKKSFFESDWKTYTSSSSEVNGNISKGIMPSSYIIVGFYKTWGATLFAEAMMQLKNNVLEDDEWLNKHIEGHFTRSCLDDNIENDIKRWQEYVKGNISPIDIPCSGLLYDIVSDSVINIDNIFSFCSENSINPSTLDRLMEGDIDVLNERYMLIPELQRSVVMYSVEDRKYDSRADILEGEGLTVKELNSHIKNGNIFKYSVEDRKSFKERLKNVREIS